MEKTLKVEGMMCAHCAAHVKDALEGLEGVREALVDLDGGSVKLTLDEDVPDERLVAAVTDAGYEAKLV